MCYNARQACFEGSTQKRFALPHCPFMLDRTVPLGVDEAKGSEDGELERIQNLIAHADLNG